MLEARIGYQFCAQGYGASVNDSGLRHRSEQFNKNAGDWNSIVTNKNAIVDAIVARGCFFMDIFLPKTTSVAKSKHS